MVIKSYNNRTSYVTATLDGKDSCSHCRDISSSSVYDNVFGINITLRHYNQERRYAAKGCRFRGGDSR